MLNRLARYEPVIRLIKIYDFKKVLEVGSGSLGIGEWLNKPFAGCDLHFDNTPTPQMTPVIGSILRLPFNSSVFDLIICVDVLEHIPPTHREIALQELLRVSRQWILLSFPHGALAQESDKKLLNWYCRLHLRSPDWLQEHTKFSFPTEREIDSILSKSGAQWKKAHNENLHIHAFLMRIESLPGVKRVLSKFSHLFPRLLGFLGSHSLFGPSYRIVYYIQQKGNSIL